MESRWIHSQAEAAARAFKGLSKAGGKGGGGEERLGTLIWLDASMLRKDMTTLLIVSAGLQPPFRPSYLQRSTEASLTCTKTSSDHAL